MDEPRKSRLLAGEVLSFAAAGLVATGVSLSVAIALGVAWPSAVTVSIMAALVGIGLATALGWIRDSHKRGRCAQRHSMLEKLTEQLAFATTREQVVSIIEHHVRHVVWCSEVSFIPAPKDGTKTLSKGLVSDSESSATLGVRSLMHGRPVSLLQVSRPLGATFSEDDVALLRATANQATLALTLVGRTDAIDRRRRQQAEAWEGERAAIIEALAAEIAHEVRYPINFFRTVFSRDRDDRQLDDEEVDIGCEEVERLERLVTDLRKVAVRRLERRSVRLLEIIGRAEMLLRDRLDGRTFELFVPEDVRVRCDPDQITQVLVNLMSNAISAAKSGEDTGIDWSETQSGANLIVWDEGAGFVCDPSVIFTPWFTTKSTGTGLGLAIAHRIVRAHGWGIDPKRNGHRTEFAVFIPCADIANADEAVSSKRSPPSSGARDEEAP